MQFVFCDDDNTGKKRLVERLVNELTAKKSVLWLVPGGSNIPTTVAALKLVREQTPVDNLTIMLSDERFGPLDHLDSNWYQLFQAGFEPGESTIIPVLTREYPLLEQAVNRYAEQVSNQIAKADNIILQNGIGPDGHTAGILPGSLASQERTKFVVGYQAGPFIRITLTFPALKQAQAAYVFAFGPAKKQTLTDLAEKALALDQQPAQLYKQLPEAYLFSDQVREKVAT